VTSGGNNFNDFPDNQLTKFRVSVDFGFPPSFNFCEASSFVHPYDGRPWQTQLTKRQLYKQTSHFFRLSVYPFVSQMESYDTEWLTGLSETLCALGSCCIISPPLFPAKCRKSHQNLSIVNSQRFHYCILPSIIFFSILANAKSFEHAVIFTRMIMI